MAIIVITSYYLDRSGGIIADGTVATSAVDGLLRLGWPLQSQCVK